jgi:hypothetical protein
MRFISPEFIDHGGISAKEAAINSPGALSLVVRSLLQAVSLCSQR